MAELFQNGTDKVGKEYFFSALSPAHINISVSFPLGDANRFSNRFLNVIPRASTSFTNDLTARDDVLLAFLALLLLLAIEGIVASLLLRTATPSAISSTAFSVKLLIELLRDLRLPTTLPKTLTRSSPASPSGSGSRKHHRLSKRLVAAAATLLTLVFGLEVLVLFLSEPHKTPVSNADATFRLLFPIHPTWSSVRFQTRAYLTRPCSSISLRRVDQGATRITACVTSDLSTADIKLFEKLKPDDPDVNLTVTSDLHLYGFDHTVRLDTLSASYSSRAFFTLGNEETRLMSALPLRSEHEFERVKNVHRQLVAFIYSAYLRATKDKAATIENLQSFDISFENPVQGPKISVARVNGRNFTTNSTRYMSTTTGKLPRGTAALRTAQNVFRSTMGIHIVDGDPTDFFFREGKKMSVKKEIWWEVVRPLNWLTLCIMLGCSVLILFGLRFVLRPVSTSDIASAYVKMAVGAEAKRSPVEMAKTENRYFKVGAVPGSHASALGARNRSGNGLMGELEEYSLDGDNRSMAAAAGISELSERPADSALLRGDKDFEIQALNIGQ